MPSAVENAQKAAELIRRANELFPAGHVRDQVVKKILVESWLKKRH